MSSSSYAQYGMYAFLAVLTVVGMYLHIFPAEWGLPIFASLVGVVIGWHIPSPQTPLAQVTTPQAVINTNKTEVQEPPH